MILDKEDIATANEMARTLQRSKNSELVVVGNLLAHLLAERSPQRQWTGLTTEERNNIWTADQMTCEEWEELFDAIEAKLKEKNNE